VIVAHRIAVAMGFVESACKALFVCVIEDFMVINARILRVVANQIHAKTQEFAWHDQMKQEEGLHVSAHKGTRDSYVSLIIMSAHHLLVWMAEHVGRIKSILISVIALHGHMVPIANSFGHQVHFQLW